MIISMIKIIKSRGTGKTSDLVRLSCESGYQYTIICRTDTERRRIKEIASNMGYEPMRLDVMTYFEATKDLLGTNKKVLIDDIDAYLQHVFCGNIFGYTVNIDEGHY